MSLLSLVYEIHATVFRVQGTSARSQPSIDLLLHPPFSAALCEILHGGRQRGTGGRKGPSRGYTHPFQSSSNITQPLQTQWLPHLPCATDGRCSQKTDLLLHQTLS
ncbi:hypothetical protein Cfor_04255 [Coptotermes formosanus]|uniref:Uncharacterized protein n=1 Tax=Coptotermes formosanus TaxID=36987 RepID=A0A6L2PC57_COPFO|nr:hypothetical protein Cfor_12297 [Coptotermes formosanus]GFG34075.1 hypothetical protein Cfor_04255 [Coptotermes formosanus]